MIYRKAEYIWVGGDGELRSKTRIFKIHSSTSNVPDVNSLNNEDETVEVDDEGNVIGGEDVMSDTDIPAEETSDTQSESESTSDISKMIDSVPSKGGGVKPNQAQIKRINNNQDLAKLNQRTSTGHKTVIVQRQVVEVPVPV